MYQASLKEKTRQMKAMASELNMYQAQVGGPERDTASVMVPRLFLDVHRRIMFRGEAKAFQRELT